MVGNFLTVFEVSNTPLHPVNNSFPPEVRPIIPAKLPVGENVTPACSAIVTGVNPRSPYFITFLDKDSLKVTATFGLLLVPILTRSA